MIPVTIRGVVSAAIRSQKNAARVQAFHSTPANINEKEVKEEEVQDPVVLEQTYFPSKAKLENNTTHRVNSHDEIVAKIGEQGSQLPKLPKTSLSPEAIKNMKAFLRMGKDDNGRG